MPVLDRCRPRHLKELTALVRPSLYRSEGWRDSLADAAQRAGVDPARALAESGADRPDADLAEGLYIKIEDADRVLGRFKWVRPGFLQTILDSGTHWHARPIIRNRLAPDVEIFLRPERETIAP